MATDFDSYTTCWTLEQWAYALKRLQKSKWRGLDFEAGPNPRYHTSTSALRVEDGALLCGIGVAWLEDGRTMSAYIGIRHDPVHAGGQMPDATTAVQMLSQAIQDTPDEPGYGWITANLQMELSVLLAEGAVWPAKGQIHDIMIGARVLNQGVGPQELIGLGPLQQKVLGRTGESESLLSQWLKAHRFKPGADIWRAPVSVVSYYCQDDARDALEIWAKWAEHLYQPPTDWWLHRAPNRMTRHDLYELEIQAGIDALTTCLRGTRFDKPMATRRAKAAETLQSVCDAWIRDRLQVPTLNPGSQDQLRGILFSESYGFPVSTAHMTETFRKLSEARQAATVAGHGEKPLVSYASLDIDALAFYAEQKPEFADLIFMLAVRRKCNTALTWFRENVKRFGSTPAKDPWWVDDAEAAILNVMYHRLRTVGTKSGRMSSSDYNGQQVPQRTKMLIALEMLVTLLTGYLTEAQLAELVAMFDIATVSDGDEAKVTKTSIGGSVIDFSPRAMFIPRPGCNIRNWDLSQVEMRGFANMSRNKLLCSGYGDPLGDGDIAREMDAFNTFIATGMVPSNINLRRHLELEARPFDIHKFVAQEIDCSRGDAKGINFGLVYGMGKKKLARERGWGREQAETYLGRYHSKFFEIATLQAAIRDALARRGYVFDSFGRRYYLPVDKAYVGLNRLIQGWAASVFKVGFVRACRVFESTPMGGTPFHRVTRRPMPGKSGSLTCVHDELSSEVEKERDTIQLDWAIRTGMTAIHGLVVPLGTSSEGSDISWDAQDTMKFEQAA